MQTVFINIEQKDTFTFEKFVFKKLDPSFGFFACLFFGFVFAFF